MATFALKKKKKITNHIFKIKPDVKFALSFIFAEKSGNIRKHSETIQKNSESLKTFKNISNFPKHSRNIRRKITGLRI